MLLKEEEHESASLRALEENEAAQNHVNVITVGNYVGIIKSKVLIIYSTYLVTIWNMLYLFIVTRSMMIWYSKCQFITS